ncbi:MAG: hypothetical protein KDB21_17355, partial [Acidimicrobiales bacterium]|nr:hypothetical protein [Acidimicrobiales bacterium]
MSAPLLTDRSAGVWRRPVPIDVDDGSAVRSVPLGARAVALWAGAYVLLTTVWTAIGFLITEVLDRTAVGEADTDVTRWFEDRRTPGRTDLSEIVSL